MISNTTSTDPFAKIEVSSKRKFTNKKTSQQRHLMEVLPPSAHAKHAPIRKEFLAKYLVNRCISCTEEYCYDAHIEQDTRRNPVYSPESGWNYKPVLCLPGRKCQYGHNCKFAHNQTEVLYHPLIFKTEICEEFKSETGSCPWGGLYCPKAHRDANFPDREPEDWHNLQDYGLRPVYLESTLEEQLEVNRRVAAASATYKSSVKRVVASESEKQQRKQSQPKAEPIKRNYENPSVKVEKAANPVQPKSEDLRANALCCFCKTAVVVFYLQCKHGLCNVCLDIDCCPKCNE
mmetsp:Transcript_10584/g.20404  ORF Transcript_10584/g.20404 Transcript_10584/m.20404 type:complete len:290 (+) Transcript_10584:2490-3359(+)|eukprot:CAMPEP_0204897136 /NCGR_PEP_ID=MMETSP1397-20131031/568_1 /ASSEMBLY_ACC=CAM_ASM_000891 /TAXON_ID=49980 /ORGANISM="Climacostomum Climacostomum virens, Strain Stock W-24" /LENGTH=289 /DNA_ID=CAMNT_0052064847 /DNA_START=18 /DNA_END=887 /DNA_ORIENTATION=+